VSAAFIDELRAAFDATTVLTGTDIDARYHTDMAGIPLCVIVNAVLDALSEYGITEINMPLTPEKVWRAIRDAEKAKAA